MIRISRDLAVYKMSADNKPAATAKNGDVVVFETNDAFGGTLTNEGSTLASIDWDRVNPATGPLYIEGAEKGDVLKVEILDIRLEKQGVMTTIPGSGAVAEYIKSERTKILPIRGGKLIFSDSIELDVKPMIGVIGTAPDGEPIPTGTPGCHGGNMDCTMISQGATLYLPVGVPGALLAMGDLHAAMGDGEVLICGVEIAGEVEVRIEVVKGLKWPLPMVAGNGLVATIASAPTLDEAATNATHNMLEFVVSELNMEPEEAGMLISAAADLRICQIVDPLLTARMELPLSILKMCNYKLK